MVLIIFLTKRTNSFNKNGPNFQWKDDATAMTKTYCPYSKIPNNLFLLLLFIYFCKLSSKRKIYIIIEEISHNNTFMVEMKYLNVNLKIISIHLQRSRLRLKLMTRHSWPPDMLFFGQQIKDQLLTQKSKCPILKLVMVFWSSFSQTKEAALPSSTS